MSIDSHCPLCYAELEVIDVAPCMDCGHIPLEIEHASEGQHTYAEYRVVGDLSLTLCDLCMLEFGLNDPTYFGLPAGSKLGSDTIRFVPSMEDVQILKDKYCPNCRRRLAFLRFVERARQEHASNQTRR
jgi:hypothetical protein